MASAGKRGVGDAGGKSQPHSTTKRDKKNKAASEVPAPCGCCPDCAGKPSGTMGGCEDGVCRDIPPPQGEGPWVLYVNANVNQGFPYWESVANVIAAGALNGKPAPAEAPPPHEKPPDPLPEDEHLL
jgi:hypothetical protein